MDAWRFLMSFSSLFKAVFLASMATMLGPVAHAESTVRAPVLEAYTQECASCHMAYPAGLLPAVAANFNARHAKASQGDFNKK
jgi:hypothetical protein